MEKSKLEILRKFFNIVEVPIQNKTVDISTQSRLLEERIALWLGMDYRYIANLIAALEDSGPKIELTNENIGNLSFRCLDKYGNVLNIELLVNGRLCEERILKIVNGDIERNYQLSFERDSINLELISINKVAKPVKKMRLCRNKN